MLSTILLICLASSFLCVGYLLDDINTIFFTLASAITATVALILAIRRYKNGR